MVAATLEHFANRISRRLPAGRDLQATLPALSGGRVRWLWFMTELGWAPAWAR